MPQVKGAPDALNNLLERVYQSCMNDKNNETSCSKIAWDAAKKAGWKKGSDGKWHKNSESDAMKKETFTCSAKLEVVHNTIANSSNKDADIDEKIYRITAMIGDRFMNGGFFSEEESQRVYKKWEGTLHDINHSGTAYPNGDILAFIGYHVNVNHNSETKEVTMDIKVNRNTMYAKAWEAYIETCELAGLIPNVSVTYLGRRKLVVAKDLPNGTDYNSEGYSHNDLVPVLTDVEPVCVSTVLRGRCNDKDGCGVRDNNTCSTGTCDAPKQDVLDDLDEKRQKLIDQIKQKEEELND